MASSSLNDGIAMRTRCVLVLSDEDVVVDCAKSFPRVLHPSRYEWYKRDALLATSAMTLAEYLEIGLRFRQALALGVGVSLLAALLVTPWSIRKLRASGIVGRDRHKPNNPEIAEMGGIAVFLAFNVGVFFVLGFSLIAQAEQNLILAGLVVCTGACMTGILDDLVDLRQRFKAFIPLAFAVPLALFVPSVSVTFPFLGEIGFGIVYAAIFVPLGIAFASNAFNMLEGFNGLGAGIGIIMACAIGTLAILSGNITGLALLAPLIGALGGFLFFNIPPAKVFPGDTMTLLVGCTLAVSAILSKVEFWAALLFIPHLIEFLLKAKAHFKVQSFASSIEDGRLRYEGPIRSLTHVVMRIWAPTEFGLVARVWVGEAIVASLVVALYVLSM